MKLTATQQSTLEATSNADFNIDAIVTRLQALDVSSCSCLEPEQVKVAFLNWLTHHLESIETDPQYFIRENSNHFDRHIHNCLMDLECREYDPFGEDPFAGDPEYSKSQTKELVF